MVYTLKKAYAMANAKQMPSGNRRAQVCIGTDQNGRKRRKSITAPIGWQAEMPAAEFLETVQTPLFRHLLTVNSL